MRVRASAGRFEFETYTEGYPHWVDVKIDGDKVARINAEDIPDLAYACQRLAQKLTDAIKDRH